MQVRIITALLCALLFPVSSFAQNDLHWVATWGTSPLLAVETPPSWVQPPPADAMPANPPPSPILPYPAQFEAQTVE